MTNFASCLQITIENKYQNKSGYKMTLLAAFGLVFVANPTNVWMAFCLF